MKYTFNKIFYIEYKFCLLSSQDDVKRIVVKKIPIKTKLWSLFEDTIFFFIYIS